MTPQEALLAEARHDRARAAALLAALQACAGADKSADAPNLYKKVTGQSCDEQILEQARRVVAAHDRLVQQLEEEVAKKVRTSAV